MYYAARIAKKKHPDAKIVFVGPCVAKRKEVRRDDAVDYILTFEEVGSILDGMDIQLEQVNSFSILHTSVREAHGFAQGGCITGPSTHNDIVSGRRQLAQELLKRKESYETMDR